MAEDHEILRETWEGKVPVCFVLARDEVFTVEQPEPFYILVPRQTYFPLVTDKMQRIFSRHIDPDIKSPQLWLEDEGQPLRWHYPVGVLFDLAGGENRLPWTIFVHFKDFPAGDLLECSSKDAVEAHFMSCVKEADCLKHRSQVINAMQRKDHRQLWNGLLNDKFDHFWSVNKKLMESSSETPLRHIPFRLHQSHESGYTQQLFRPHSEEEGERRDHTLEDLIHQFAPHALPGQSQDSCRRLRVLIQGVEPPLSTSIVWLSQHFSHPDNFLHICLVPVS